MMKQVTLMFAALAVAVSASAQSARETAERAQDISRVLFPRGAPSNYLDAKITDAAPGKVRALLTVLPGVLYRGGGLGGKKPLSTDTLKSLCEAGFSTAVYAYTENFSPVKPIPCTVKSTGKSNTIEYVSGNANDSKFKEKFLGIVKRTIEDGSKGPVFVHCWNGMHASGELAAVSLRQFCGWDGDSASNYWHRHAGGFPMISRVRKFTPSSSLAVSADQREELCRDRN